jgi:hypothetical protein
MLHAQGGVCGICELPPEQTARKSKTLGRHLSLHVDHCHRTGVVRGLLCHRCNQSIAQFEKAEWRFRMNQYLEGNYKPWEADKWPLLP